MARFYLHMCDGTGFAEDTEGSEFPDLTAAREAAIRGLRESLTWDLLQGTLYTTAFIEIEDDRHRLMDTVHFRDAITLQETDGSPPKRRPPRRRSAG